MHQSLLLNMTNPNASAVTDKYDYVTGYMDLEKGTDAFHVFDIGADHYAAIQVKLVSKGDVLSDFSRSVNPISKAGWYFGRQYLNNIVYSLTGEEDVNNLKAVVANLINLIPQILDIFKNANTQLQEKFIAQKFIPNKSWIRLMQPEGKKLGGGSRVKEIKIKDEWDIMTNHNGEEVYKQFYGQQYSYTAEDGISSSGVAAYEPLGDKENPFVYPFFDQNYREAALAPDSQNYVELPFGESFYPSPKVTYSRVTVNNLPREKTEASVVVSVKKHATGKVVTEFFTTKDYPTLSDLTLISSKYDDSPLGSLLGINVKTHLSMSQGFSIHTNDMDGKMKNQWVYGEGQTSPISGMEYKYEQLDNAQPNQGKLNNEVFTIDEEGTIAKSYVGVDYDVVNDFTENYSENISKGVNVNLEILPFVAFILFIPVPIPSYARHENILKKSVTTKAIHTSAILREKIAYDLGSQVSTKNLAWDANTGEVMLTETVNEYNDKYYNINMPAYWANKGMDQAALNIGLESAIEYDSDKKSYKFSSVYHANNYLIDGDEIWVTSTTLPINKKGFKAWVVNVKSDGFFDLITNKGLKIIGGVASEDTRIKVLSKGVFKVIRSGHRNLQMASMASVTLMKNPLYQYNGNEMTSTLNSKIYTNDSNVGNSPFYATSPDKNRIVNASAIEYNNEWPTQCDCGLPKMSYNDAGKLTYAYNQNSTDDYDILITKSYNPYVYNILGNWRPVKSYAYLTGRNNTIDPTPRKTGYFNDFKSFYVYNATAKKWEAIQSPDYNKWTFASEVTKYSPYGQEVENKDALGRSSAALYGYNNRFPTAVASNTMFTELANDGFEDYDFNDCKTQSHFSYMEALRLNRVSITSKQAHTGRKSIRLEPKERAIVSKKITNCNNVITTAPATKQQQATQTLNDNTK